MESTIENKRLLVKVRRIIRFFKKRFNFCKSSSKIKMSKIEEYVYLCTKEVLKFKDTDIEVDEFGKRYAVENEYCHFTLKILGNSDAVLMTNTHDNVEKKLSTLFVTEVIAMILKEKNKRMEGMFSRMQQREVDMCGRIYNMIKNETERRNNK